QPRHHRHRSDGEQLLGVADPRAPRDLAAVAVLGLAGDLDALLAGGLAEPGNPARLGGGALGATRVTLGELALHRPQRADDDDLLAVHRDLRCRREPPVGEAAREPGGGVVGAGQVGLLPSTPARSSAAAYVPSPVHPSAHLVLLRCSPRLRDYTDTGVVDVHRRRNAAATSSGVVTGRSHTKPRHT